MLIPARLYIASCAAESLERTFAFDPGFLVLGGSRWGREAVREAMRLGPDVLALDSALLGMDGLEALEKLKCMAAPPRVLFLSRMRSNIPDAQVDGLVRDPWTDAELLLAAHAAADRPLPILAAPWAEARRDIAEALLRRLGVKERLKGRAYMAYAAAAMACAPQWAASYSAWVYPRTAAAFGTSAGAVERAVRTAVEDTWLHGDLAAIQALFGYSVDAERGKPTNAEFLSMLAEHVRRGVEKQIREKQRQT